jgi:hypothetical protein
MKHLKGSKLARTIALSLLLSACTGTALAAAVVGIEADGTTKTVTAPVTVNNPSGGAKGVYAHNNGTINMNVSTGGNIITVNAAGTAENDTAYAVYARDDEGKGAAINFSTASGGTLQAVSANDLASIVYALKMLKLILIMPAGGQ